MHRKPAVYLSIALFGVMLTAAPVAAGGGCGPGHFSDERTTTILTEHACFTPTVARIEVGDTVTFKNPETLEHMVGGMAGSFGALDTELGPHESVSYRFRDEGVYPYVCILHAGMGGAIVVGDGEGKGTASAVTKVPPAPADPAPASGREAAPSEERLWLVPLGIALGIAVLVLAAIPIRRRTTSATP